MKPPYHPDHVEAVNSHLNRQVYAVCSCGWHGDYHTLTGDRLESISSKLIVELNEHRATYVEAAS